MTTTPDTATCFIIAPIGADGSPTRIRSDQVLRHIIAPAVQDCGYAPIRADEITETGIITSHVVQHILSAAVVVADLTGCNPNVFYELALCHAFDKPVVPIAENDEKIPFDVAALRIIFFNHHDLDSAARARNVLAEQIRSAVDHSVRSQTPVNVALQVRSWEGSNDPAVRRGAEILSALHDMQVSLTELTNTTRQTVTDLTSAGQRQIENVARAAEDRIADVAGMGGKRSASEMLPVILNTLLSETPPDAKLQPRLNAVLRSIMTLKEHRSWEVDCALKSIGELLYFASENAISLARVAASGGAQAIRLPRNAQTMYDNLLASLISILDGGDSIVSLSDISSLRDEFSQSIDATRAALQRGVKIRRLICPFEHDFAIPESEAWAIIAVHWTLALEGPRGEDDRPYYELGIVTRTQVRGFQLHVVTQFTHRDRSVALEPRASDFSEVSFALTTEAEPAYISQLWPRAARNHSFISFGGDARVMTLEEVRGHIGNEWRH